MPTWVHSAVFRLVIALATAVGMLLSPVGMSASHNPVVLTASETVQSERLKAQLADCGLYDGDTEDRQGLGHSFGHSPDDHSHEIPNTLAFVKMAGPPIARIFNACAPAFVAPETTSRLERPPRTFFVT